MLKEASLYKILGRKHLCKSVKSAGKNKKSPTKIAGEKSRSQRKGNFKYKINALKKILIG